jgi:hypothetical protein
MDGGPYPRKRITNEYGHAFHQKLEKLVEKHWGRIGGKWAMSVIASGMSEGTSLSVG